MRNYRIVIVLGVAALMVAAFTPFVSAEDAAKKEASYVGADKCAKMCHKGAAKGEV